MTPTANDGLRGLYLLVSLVLLWLTFKIGMLATDKLIDKTNSLIKKTFRRWKR